MNPVAGKSTVRRVTGIGLSSMPGLNRNGITMLKFTDENSSWGCRPEQRNQIEFCQGADALSSLKSSATLAQIFRDASVPRIQI